ncbi:MAG: hypothetical protein GEU81_14350 [Nitriliruptorales bacterium]|nr:hypothetical protein [Nitriliruptorales bacterium]
MSVILLETAVGGSIVLWASGVWGAVRRGFFLLVGVAVALCALGAWLLTADLVRAASGESVVAQGFAEPILAALAGPAGSRALLGLGVFTGLLALWQILLIARQESPARMVGLVASVAGVTALVLFGFLRPPTVGQAIAELALGSVFLGSTLFGLLLGHWYLVERRLSKVYMIRGAWWYIAGVLAAVAAVALSATNPAQAPAAGFNPLLAIPSFTLLLGGGLVAICALIAGFVWKLAQEGGRSIQAATGMFYLAVLMAFSAEMSTKVRFF